MIKRSKYYLLTAFLLTINVIDVYSQMSTNLMKYWYYRDRLKYFVIPGNKIGESQIICVRNKMSWPERTDSSKNVDYGQQGKYTGLYLGVLATEYYLLHANGQTLDANKTYIIN